MTVDPVEVRTRTRIETLAYRLWLIHPRDVPDPIGMPDRFPGGARAWFYANEISALVADAVEAERENCAALCDAEAAKGDDAVKWGGSKQYISDCKAAVYAIRDRAAAIRARSKT